MQIHINKTIAIKMYENFGSKDDRCLENVLNKGGDFNVIFENDIVFLTRGAEQPSQFDEWRTVGELIGDVDHFGRILIYDSEIRNEIDNRTRENENWVIETGFCMERHNALIYFHKIGNVDYFNVVYLDYELDHHPKISSSIDGIMVV